MFVGLVADVVGKSRHSGIWALLSSKPEHVSGAEGFAAPR